MTPSILHQHHAIQLSSGDSHFEYRLNAGADYHAQPAFLLNADVAHQTRSNRGLNLYIEPESSAGMALQTACFQNRRGVYPIDDLPMPDTASLLNSLHSIEDARELTCHLLSLFIPQPAPAAPPDERIQVIKLYIRKHLAECLSIEVLAQQVYLSPSRLMHLFSEQAGVSIRRYILWQRIIRANYAISQGASLTETAHQAGFADSAHLSRTFREMIGHPPSAIFGRSVQFYFDAS